MGRRYRTFHRKADLRMPSTTSRPRIELFDNIKGVLIFLVLFAHVMIPIQNDNPAMSTVFDLIYLFHMPLFVFMSGLFAKGAYRNGRLDINRIISFVLLGVLFQEAILAVNGSSKMLEKIFLFSSAPWYMIAMAWWYAATPLLARVHPAVGIGVSYVVALLWGPVDLSNGLFAISRAIEFLPWFAAGYYLDPMRVTHIKAKRWAWAAVALAAVIAVARIADPHMFDWFFQRVYGDAPYQHGFVSGMVEKTVATAIAVVFSIAAIKLTPQGGVLPLSRLGQATLKVYILHRLIRAAMVYRLGFYKLPILLDPLWGMLIAIVASIAITLLCMAIPLDKPLDFLMRRPWIPQLQPQSKR